MGSFLVLLSLSFLGALATFLGGVMGGQEISTLWQRTFFSFLISSGFFGLLFYITSRLFPEFKKWTSSWNERLFRKERDSTEFSFEELSPEENSLPTAGFSSEELSPEENSLPTAGFSSEDFTETLLEESEIPLDEEEPASEEFTSRKSALKDIERQQLFESTNPKEIATMIKKNLNKGN